MKKLKLMFTIITLSLFFTDCSKGDSNDTIIDTNLDKPSISSNKSSLTFEDTMLTRSSIANSISISSKNLNSSINVSISNNFELSLDNITFQTSIILEPNKLKNVYVRFSPTELGNNTGNIKIENSQTSSTNITLSGSGVKLRLNYKTFNKQHLAFGSGNSQFSIQKFDLHNDLKNVESIKMYIQLECPSGGCNAWDVYSNIMVKDPDSSEWFEIGRYITPYGTDNKKLDRGFEIDVTDFKSQLKGNVELKSFIEVWGSDGWNLTVDFDYIIGDPDFTNYKVSRIIQYNGNSLQGVVYGEDESEFDLSKSIEIGENVQNAHIRTIITGWGHATPNDDNGRPCAEWCYRTHNIKINNINTFQHYMGPIGCGSNPISPQNGNWEPDRAGWCPGMEVPVRLNKFTNDISNSSFNFEYDFENWVNDLKSSASNIHAYYAISSFIVLKSNNQINAALVTE
ncbi:peptide-N-glycosidase F-related protein [Flavobacteriaceae bacterium]|jgi:hypothetical protein|nr:peptide-N-glycosidase F-related protein [Flavobacteriaceae bacterium]MDB0043654.1 peptide-N-glycosidase F-related protein [Flavobacteriaceae bacterium]MDB4050979.1 peptide-N-glycosidase F-related protein [Flavobacteriaceae bacterium]MDB4086800.1 peptide-N-glycosidase F-related protein [Flavobacteriaceae bacterium]MDB9901920.1 peptide-N-glycosidase F-related protein [Flavobacteriaceae bacterium]